MSIGFTQQVFPVACSTERGIPPSTITFAPRLLSIDVNEVVQNGKRYYSYNEQLYPSITTLIRDTDREGNAALQKWRKSVGHVRAETITSRAASRGTQWHNFCEQFVSGQPIAWSLLTNPDDMRYASAVASTLNQQLDTVFASETRVASSTYGVAGRMDQAVRLRDGRCAILDFKTGSKLKYGQRLANYAVQATFYADALMEHLPDVQIDTIIIAQLLPTEIVWQESSPALWRDSLRERIASYATLLNEQLG